MKPTTWKTAGLFMALIGAASIAEAQGPGNGRGGRMSREDLMKKYDADGDGQLNEAERTKLREEMSALRGSREGESRGGPGGERGQMPSAAEIIKKYDKDGNGELSAAELEVMLQEQRQRVQQRGGRGGSDMQGRGGRGGQGGQGGRMSREQIMEKYDANGDGELSEDERAALREDMQKRRGGRQ